jgi:hypothetical protein
LNYLNSSNPSKILPATSYEYIELEAQKEALRDIYRRSLYRTAHSLLGYSEITPDTHGPIIRVLQSNTKKKLIVVPRGCFKSTLASVAYPIWRLNKNPNERILLDSELYSNSSKFLREISAHLETQKLTDLFGPYRGKGVWNESEITINQRNIIKKEASITCSGIGAQKTSQHYECIIADDLNSPDNSQTKDACEKVIDHYRLYISLLEPGGTLVVIGTRYSYADLIEHILTNEIERKGLL